MDTRPDYQERLRVPLRWWAQGTMLVAIFWLSLIVSVPEPVAWSATGVAMSLIVSVPEPVAWSATGVAMALLVLGLGWYGDARINVGDGWFTAGNARIEARHLGAADALDTEETRRVSGPDADARAFLLLRPYVKQSVRVEITDPADPTPYWLVSSRHPEALATALTTLVKG